MKIVLAPGASDTFVFYASPDFWKKQIGRTVKLEFVLENRFSQRYKEQVEMIITSMSDQVYIDLPQWYSYMFFQNYKIYRFERDSDGNVFEVEESVQAIFR